MHKHKFNDEATEVLFEDDMTKSRVRAFELIIICEFV